MIRKVVYTKTALRTYLNFQKIIIVRYAYHINDVSDIVLPFVKNNFSTNLY